MDIIIGSFGIIIGETNQGQATVNCRYTPTDGHVISKINTHIQIHVAGGYHGTLSVGDLSISDSEVLGSDYALKTSSEEFSGIGDGWTRWDFPCTLTWRVH